MSTERGGTATAEERDELHTSEFWAVAGRRNRTREEAITAIEGVKKACGMLILEMDQEMTDLEGSENPYLRGDCDEVEQLAGACELMEWILGEHKGMELRLRGLDRRLGDRIATKMAERFADVERERKKRGGEPRAWDGRRTDDAGQEGGAGETAANGELIVDRAGAYRLAAGPGSEPEAHAYWVVERRQNDGGTKTGDDGRDEPAETKLKTCRWTVVEAFEEPDAAAHAMRLVARTDVRRNGGRRP